MGVNREALQLHAVSKKLYLSMLQVMQESVSGTISHVCASEHAMKSKVHCTDGNKLVTFASVSYSLYSIKCVVQFLYLDPVDSDVCIVQLCEGSE